MSIKKWNISKYNKDLAKELAEECNVDPITALIATARGYTDFSELDEFLSDEPVFSDPKELVDISLAAEIINNEIDKGTVIAIYGDYDCDGITATTILYRYIKSRTENCIYYIPDRFDEGYGMNCNAIDFLKEKNVGLLITVDNGISCESEILHAKSLGMKVIVTDHHIPPDSLPSADAVVDPYRKDCPSTYKTICGAEVAFKLICVIEDCEPEELLSCYADLLTLAVIADVMPLTMENRSIVKIGIRKIKSNPSVGLSAIMNTAGINRDNINSIKIAFGITPRINATGRMGNAKRAVELLLCEDMMTALSIATEIEDKNTERQKTEKSIYDDAISIIESNNYLYDRVIIVSNYGWHKGVIGIVASKISERYGAPCFVISCDGDNAVGSGRSIEGFSLYDAVMDSGDLLTKFGGHKSAAGISLSTDNIDKFRKKINDYAYKMPFVCPTLNLDCRLNPSALSIDLAESIKQLEPFGTQNPTPIFGIYGVKLAKITPLSAGKHLKLTFVKDEASFEALLFGMSLVNLCFDIGDILDLAVSLDTNYYKDSANLSVLIKALRVSGTNDEKLFYDIDNFNKLISKRECDNNTLLPSRNEVGAIYKYITAKTCSKDKVKYKFINTIGYSKTMVSLICLVELNLIKTNKNDFYESSDSKNKTELSNSELYSRLLKGCEDS